ncbi:MAG TPA: 4Fe-4S dicluster domain-containing protein, partial [Thermococcus litoralis]|nr:4Fe-4S dicluster domain-containing protein [Thermococcus litoralis]
SKERDSIKIDSIVFTKEEVRAKSRKDAVRAYSLIKRAYECVGCGVCVGKCPENALRINSHIRKIKVDSTRCIHCGECMEVCPLLKIKNPQEGSQL